MFCFNPFVLLLCVVKRPDKSPEAFVVSDVSWSELLPRDGAELRLLSCAMCIVGPMKSGGHMGGCYFCICDVSVSLFSFHSGIFVGISYCACRHSNMALNKCSAIYSLREFLFTHLLESPCWFSVFLLMYVHEFWVWPLSHGVGGSSVLAASAGNWFGRVISWLSSPGLLQLLSTLHYCLCVCFVFSSD